MYRGVQASCNPGNRKDKVIVPYGGFRKRRSRNTTENRFVCLPSLNLQDRVPREIVLKGQGQKAT